MANNLKNSLYDLLASVAMNFNNFFASVGVWGRHVDGHDFIDRFIIVTKNNPMVESMAFEDVWFPAALKPIFQNLKGFGPG